MANPLGAFDKDLVASAWFDTTQQPAGWFSSGGVTTEEASFDVMATVALTEVGDSLTSAGSVAVSGTTSLTQGADTASGQGAVAVSSSASLTQDTDTLVSVSTILVSGAVALTESSDSFSATGDIVSGVTATVDMQETWDSLTASSVVDVATSGVFSESSDTLVASGTVASGAVDVEVGIALAESNDTLQSSGAVTTPSVGTDDYPFFSTGFWSSGFFSQDFWGRLPKPLIADAKSAYWRLFYYNLQEEELKKYEQKQRETASEGTRSGEKESPRRGPEVISQPRKTDKRSDSRVIQEDEPIPSLPKPIYQGYNRVQLPDVSPLLYGIFTEFAQWESSLRPLQDRLIQTEAANEEDYRVRLLLLLAA